MALAESAAPTPPPLPPVAYRKTPVQVIDGNEALFHGNSMPFIVHGEALDSIEFEFPKSSDAAGSLFLRVVVGHYLGQPQASRASANNIYQILGRLRCLYHALASYNAGLSTLSLGFTQYWRKHTLNLLSGFGYRSGSQLCEIHVAGLAELIDEVEHIYEPSITEARSLINTGLITFGGLGELFRPDVFVKASIISGDAPSVFRVTDSFYEEHRTLFGSQKRFRVTMEFVVLVGQHFSVASFSDVMLAWTGPQARSFSAFVYQPVSDLEQKLFLERAEKVVKLGLGRPNYLQYSPDSFYMHLSRSSQTTCSSLSRPSNSSKAHTGGRIMIDMARGASLGHYPCQGADEATLSIMELSRRYRQWQSNHAQRKQQSAFPENETMFVWEQVPPELLVTCWPALVGMSFTAKAWGHVLVSGLSQIEFQDRAFDQLVLSEERKQLIQAVVRRGTAVSQTQDLITGKQGGLIFLLHGVPGVGKTLTAEAVAEMLHTPLYYITMGELGVTPLDLEQRLTDVLNLCAEWNAIAVLDEADVFLETRGSSDLVRNAMVCVMLRTLEYHPGILFLTTNRVRSLDPAFESRITVALRYDELDAAARLQVWRNQLRCVSGISISDIDIEELAKQHLNGRQIKNAVRLALSVALDRGTQLTQSILLKTIEITSLGRQNMASDDTWNKANADVNIK